MLILLSVATKMNTIFIFTKTEGKRLAIARTHLISSCCKDEYYFYVYEKRKETMFLVATKMNAIFMFTKEEEK